MSVTKEDLKLSSLLKKLAQTMNPGEEILRMMRRQDLKVQKLLKLLSSTLRTSGRKR